MAVRTQKPKIFSTIIETLTAYVINLQLQFSTVPVRSPTADRTAIRDTDFSHRAFQTKPLFRTAQWIAKDQDFVWRLLVWTTAM